MLAVRASTRLAGTRHNTLAAASPSSNAIRRAPLSLPKPAATYASRLATRGTASAQYVDYPLYPEPYAQSEDVQTSEEPGFFKQLLKHASKLVMLGALAFGLMMCSASAAFASSGKSGGRVGGFHGSSRTHTVAPSSYGAGMSSGGTSSYWEPHSYGSSRTTVVVQSTPSVSFGFFPVMPFGFGGGYGYHSSSNGVVTLLLLVFVIWAAVTIFNNFNRSREEYEEDHYIVDDPPVSVARLQVALLSSARALKLELNQLAQKADTSGPQGLHMVLQETVLAMLRHPEYCVYADGGCEVVRGAEEAEQRFGALSLQSRSKIGAETLSNYGGMSRQGSYTVKSSLTEVDELMVVTLMVAAEAEVQIPKIRSIADLKQALTALGGINAGQVMGVELLWTPQAEGDYLTRNDVMSDYPHLVPL